VIFIGLGEHQTAAIKENNIEFTFALGVEND